MSWTTIDRQIEVISTWMARASGFFTLVLMAIMLVDVATRLSTGSSLAGAFELSETLVVLIVFFGIAFVERSGNNVRVTVVTERLPARVANLLRAVGTLVTMLVIVWFAYATFTEAISSYQIREFHVGLVNFPLWPARVVVVLGFIALFFEFLATLVRQIRELSPDKYKKVKKMDLESKIKIEVAQ
ncbi:TRAP transporter small permease [Arthrobacter sp. UCD-GKA]|uniref:TRAP transporter small permease subunit n=1 Tax=Arthrobacter sp. UCD-GKA TaxID=1913576 RepID=UPI0009F6F775|nr:TRAP transporter small permease [Arthrobacter sp. UCD-GKA]